MYKWLFLFLFPLVSFAQQASVEPYYFSIKPKVGFLAAHRGVMGHLPKEHAIGGEISIYKRFSDCKKWQSVYRQPYAGFTIYGSTVGNNAILGQAIGAYGFIEFPFINGKRHVLTGKLGSGVGYITKVFNQETNPKNVAMSTHINALICIGLQGRIKIGQKDELLYSFDLTHLSNGSYRVPNLGLNMPYIGVGYAHNFMCREKQPDTTFIHQTDVKTPWMRNWKWSVIGILSSKEVFPTGGKQYPVYALAISKRKVFRPKTGMEVTVDLISKQALFGYKSYVEKSQWKIFQVGVYVGYVLPLDRFHFVLGMGAYVKDRYNADDRFYHRLGMRYQFDNGLVANLTLKAHWARADYVEWGIGYTFGKNRKR